MPSPDPVSHPGRADASTARTAPHRWNVCPDCGDHHPGGTCCPESAPQSPEATPRPQDVPDEWRERARPAEMRGEDVPAEVLAVAHCGYSMHGAGLTANLIAAAWGEIERRVRERAEQEFRTRLNKVLHDADWGGPDRGDVITEVRTAFDLPEETA